MLIVSSCELFIGYMHHLLCSYYFIVYVYPLLVEFFYSFLVSSFTVY